MKLRHFLTTLLGFVAALAFWKKREIGQFRMKYITASKPLHPEFGFAYTVRQYCLMHKDTGNGIIYQWRLFDNSEAMSPVFTSEEEARNYCGPFMTDAERKLYRI